MNAEMLAAVNAEVDAIERQLSSEDLMQEVRQHLVTTTGDYACPICDAKLKDFAQGLIYKVTLAIEAASTAEEKWQIAKSARDAFRLKSNSLREERSIEFQKILAMRDPWRTKNIKPTPLGSCSAPESICSTGVKKVEEVF